MQALPASLVLRAVLRVLQAWLLCWQGAQALEDLMRQGLWAWLVRASAGQAWEVQVQMVQGVQRVLQLGLVVGLCRGPVGVGGMGALGLLESPQAPGRTPHSAAWSWPAAPAMHAYHQNGGACHRESGQLAMQHVTPACSGHQLPCKAPGAGD